METTTPQPEIKRRGRPKGSTTTDEYDPGLTIRVPRAIQNGLRALAKERQTSISDVVRDRLPGMDWYATETGQRALTILEQLIALSTTVHKGVNEFGPDGAPDEWNGLPVTRYGPDPNGDSTTQPAQPTRYVHYVRQREGQTRNEAIRHYATTVWGVVSVMNDEEQRNEALRALRNDNEHAFVIAYVGLGKWRTFPGAYELSIYERIHPRPDGCQPANDNEQRVYDHFVAWFNALVLDWAKVNDDNPGRFVLYDGYQQREDEGKGDAVGWGIAGGVYIDGVPTPDEIANGEPVTVRATFMPGLEALFNRTGITHSWGYNETFSFEFRWYPDETPDEGIARWARQMVEHYTVWANAYRDNAPLFATATGDEFIHQTRYVGYYVTSLRWLETGRKSGRKMTA